MLTLSQRLRVFLKYDSIPIDRVCDASSLGVPLGVREVLFLIGFRRILCACAAVSTNERHRTFDGCEGNDQ